MWEKISSLEHHSNERLAERRKRGHYRVLVMHALLFCILFAATVYGLWQSPVRISRVVVYGGDQALAQVATAAIQGSYLGVIPRDSTFFLPEARIRSEIIAEHPDIAAVSIFRSGLTGISIKVSERVAVARWCGLAPLETPAQVRLGVSDSLSLTGRAPDGGHGSEEYCYVFDASGYVFAVAASSTQTLNSFRFYSPLEGDTLEPLRATLANVTKLPAIFDFARKLATFNAPVTMIVVRGDEVDMYVKSGTRVTYVLSNEQYAVTALVSGRKSINLANGSLEYVDLRFEGKVYLKKK